MRRAIGNKHSFPLQGEAHRYPLERQNPVVHILQIPECKPFFLEEVHHFLYKARDAAALKRELCNLPVVQMVPFAAAQTVLDLSGVLKIRRVQQQMHRVQIDHLEARRVE